MRNSIVEGEPGAFPDPIARFFVRIARWLRRRRAGDAAERPADQADS